ncbi:MAG: hypothetical protein AYK23_04515 [Candidatus Proteinoplasmatales archaeon SG8-5]|nr:MAG: hypothetical protein AYK23_04515 [Candidatus Proteinoplasmatales archaeon SG8-5]
MNPRVVLTSKPVTLLGIIGPVIAMLAIAVAIALSPWFSFSDNALSDLGVSSVAAIFNWGLIICGAMMAPFILGLWLRIADGVRLRKVGLALLFLAALALIGIGVFTEDSMDLHFFVSFAFFVLLLSGLLFFGVSTLADAELRIIGIIAMVSVAIGMVAWAVDWGGVAIPELLSAVPAMLVLIILAVKTYAWETTKRQ